MKVCDYLGKEPLGDYLELCTIFNGIWDKLSISAYDDSFVVLYSNGRPLFVNDVKNGFLRIVPEVMVGSNLATIIHNTTNATVGDFITELIEGYFDCKFKRTVWLLDRGLIDKLIDSY
jgi:hypothetical protein